LGQTFLNVPIVSIDKILIFAKMGKFDQIDHWVVDFSKTPSL
jgi:hypothetical protein